MIHRDLKSANILLTETYEGRLADCGESRRLDRENDMTST